MREMGLPGRGGSVPEWEDFLSDAMQDPEMPEEERMKLGKFLLANREAFSGIIMPQDAIRWLMLTAPGKRPAVPEITPDMVKAISDGSAIRDTYGTRRCGVIPPVKKRRKPKPWDQKRGRI